MTKARIIQNSFNAGEISPLMYGRVDFPRYQNGVETLENWFLQTQGGVTRRWGTEYIADAKDMTAAVRLIPFEFAGEVFCLIELGDLYIRIHRIYPAAAAVDVTPTVTLYSASELFEIQYAQSGDVIFLTHGNHPVRKLSRLLPDSSSWGIKDVVFDPQPSYEKEQYPAVTIAPAAITGTGIKFRAGDNYFLAGDVDKEIQFSDYRAVIRTIVAGEIEITVDILDDWPAASIVNMVAAGNITGAGVNITSAANHGLTAANVGDSVIVTAGAQAGEVRVIIGITGLATFDIDAAFSGSPAATWNRGVHMDASAWKLTGTPSSKITSDKTAPVGAIATLTLATAGWRNVDATKGWDVTDVGKFVKCMGGLLRITAWTSTTVVSAEILRTLDDAPTTAPWETLAGTWTIEDPAWSASAGYPAAVNFFEQRLWFAGTATKVQTVWGSAIGDYENFSAGTYAVDSVEYTLATNDLSPVRWLTSGRVLLIGSAGREFRASGGAGAISPTNIDIRPETPYGSPKRRPIQIGHTTIFIQRAGRKLRELEYSFESDNYKGADLTVIAPHISEGGFQELAYSQEPYSIMYAIRGDGEIALLAYEKAQEVFGWGRWVTDGSYESIAVLPPEPGTDEYQVFVLVNRTIGGATKRYIEKFHSSMHSDCGIYGTQAAALTTPAGALNHLIGKTVTMKGDGGYNTPAVVDAAGQVTFPAAVTSYDVGLPYTSTLVTHKPEITSASGGTVQGKPKKWSSLYIRVLDTIGLKVNGTQVGTRDPAMLMGVAPTAETGDFRADVLGIDGDAKITITQDLPFPATVLAIMGELTVGD